MVKKIDLSEVPLEDILNELELRKDADVVAKTLRNENPFGNFFLHPRARNSSNQPVNLINTFSIYKVPGNISGNYAIQFMSIAGTMFNWTFDDPVDRDFVYRDLIMKI